jgi:heptosyltransferase-2
MNFSGSWRRRSVESVVAILVFILSRRQPAVSEPRRIFVLRNNDIGDLLVVTPLFEALKRRFPQAEIGVGVGSWNRAVLENNPWVDHVFTMDAPWHNQVVGGGYNTVRGFLRSLRYLFTSADVGIVRNWRPDVGIDVLGSPEGAVLLARAGIPQRVGMRGYAYGGGTYQQSAAYDATNHVGQGGLRLTELLGVVKFPDVRPQIFLTPEEEQEADAWWKQAGEGPRVVLGPGGGYEAKRWPENSFRELVDRIGSRSRLAILGSAKERDLGSRVAHNHRSAHNLCGSRTLRQSFALVARADAVVCNSSMLMHVAAAFHKPCVTVLGPVYAEAGLHQKQWGYPEPAVILGKSGPDDALPTIDAVVAALEDRWTT